jgi:hypothetical protein
VVRPSGIGDFVCGAPAARRFPGALSAPLVLLSNGLFFLGFLPVLATSSVRWPPLVARLQADLERRWRPILYMGWHAYSWCAYLVFRELPAALRPTSIAHDGVASRFNSRCGSWLGLDTLVYQRHAPVPPRQQIVDYALERRRHLVLFPDSGGPYRVLKPGIVSIARALDARVVPFAIRSRRAVRIGRRMRHLLPLPTARLELLCGDPLAGDDIDERRFSRALCELEGRADAALPTDGGATGRDGFLRDGS